MLAAGGVRIFSSTALGGVLGDSWQIDCNDAPFGC